MELKTARLTLLIDPAKKVAFEQLCAHQDLTPSQVVRQLIREYLAAHGVDYVPSGSAASSPAADGSSTRTAPAARPARLARPARAAKAATPKVAAPTRRR